jgi:lipopolysaccharide export system protein LptC
VNTTQTATALLLALLAAAVLVLNQQDYVPGETGARTDGRDAYVEDMSLRVMDSNGLPVYNMTARRMTHYSESDQLVLDSPLLYMARADGSVWRASAERGESTSQGDRVWLRGTVDIQRMPDNSHGSLHITSTDILVKPTEKLAETDSTAVIITDNYRIEAVGLKADFGTNKLELRSRVRGTLDAAG